MTHGVATQLRLTTAEERALERFAQDPATPARQAARASIVLYAASGASNREVARRTGTSEPTVALWRSRYLAFGLDGLRDRPRSGRPRVLGGVPRPAVVESSPEPAASAARESRGAGDGGLEPLLEAACTTISRRGFASTRVADIAEEAGVSPATVHYHFRSKEEILVRALLWANERLLARVDAATSPADDPVTRLATFVERTIPYRGVQQDEYLLEIDLWSQVRSYPELLPAWERYCERWIGHVAELIAAGIDAGVFTPVASAAETAERIVALTDGLAAQASIQSSRMPPTRVRDLVMRFVAEQVGIDDATLAARARLPAPGDAEPPSGDVNPTA